MIETERLIVRPWQDSDRAPFAAMCADPAVMEHLGPLQTRAQSDRLIDGQQVNQAVHASCFWAVERLADAALLGFCGINPGPAATPIALLPEIGWRLARHAWGQGFAREAAAACLAWAWAERDWPAVYAITTPANTRSWTLMERLGMVRDRALDFADPSDPPDHSLSAHIAYVASRPYDAAPFRG